MKSSTAIALSIGVLLVVVALSGVLLAALRANQLRKIEHIQQFLADVNAHRRHRAEHPELERALFPQHQSWSDAGIKAHLAACEFTSELELAYVARRAGALTKSEWIAAIHRWQKVALVDERSRYLFTVGTWTMGTNGVMHHDLSSIVSGDSTADPRTLWSVLF